MVNVQYKSGSLFCRRCGKSYPKEICPFHQSKVQRYQICPKCPQKFKLRVSAHNKNHHIYYQAVTKHSIEQNRDIVVLYKQKRKTDLQ